MRGSSAPRAATRPPKDELGRLRSREEPERHERRAQARRDVEDAARAGGTGRWYSAPSDARAAASRPGRGCRSGRRACARPGRGRRPPPEASSTACGKWQRRMLRSASSAASSRRPLAPARPARPRVGTGHADALAMQLDHLALVREQPHRREVGHRGALRERVAGDREIVVAEDREARLGNRASSKRSRSSPEPRESRSPVRQTRSGRRLAVHSTARSTATPPREGSPRWKSERCATRRPSSLAGSPAIGTSSVRSRTQPASNQPQAMAAAAAPASGLIRRSASRQRAQPTPRAA